MDSLPTYSSSSSLNDDSAGSILTVHFSLDERSLQIFEMPSQRGHISFSIFIWLVFSQGSPMQHPQARNWKRRKWIEGSLRWNFFILSPTLVIYMFALMTSVQNCVTLPVTKTPWQKINEYKENVVVNWIHCECRLSVTNVRYYDYHYYLYYFRIQA